MNIERQKDNILAYIRQFETDKSIGLIPDRTRRGLLRRFNRQSDAKPAYDALIKEHEIHESGDGSRGNPVIVNLGPRPESNIKPVVPQPWSNIELLDLIAFVVRIHDYYETKNWPLAALDIRAELKKALSEYQPGRPY